MISVYPEHPPGLRPYPKGVRNANLEKGTRKKWTSQKKLSISEFLNTL